MANFSSSPSTSPSFFCSSVWIMEAAVDNGNPKELAELMHQQESGWTLLSQACATGKDSVIPLLLAHPDIDVNAKDVNGWTPLLWACRFGFPSCVRELLKDPRVKLNEFRHGGFTPLWYAANHGELDVIKWWIASGREMDLGTPGKWGDVIGMAKKFRKTEVVTLLERFKSDTAQTRHAMRVELGWYDEAAAEMFALVVFISDELLQIKDTKITTPAARFFDIARSLPLELQMVLCHRLVGSPKETVQGRDSEVAFKELAERLLWPLVFTV